MIQCRSIDVSTCSQFALRWRTEDEVVSGSGETSCGNTRCKHHDIMNQNATSSSTHKRSKLALHTLELPFGYSEDGEAKSALVKVVLCDKCVKKIMWKREQAKKALAPGSRSDSVKSLSLEKKAEGSLHESSNPSLSRNGPDTRHDERGTHRRRRSRSLSPSRDPDKRHKRR
jgi:protein FRA10AC1